MAESFDFSEFSRQSPKGIIVNYFVILYKVLKAGWALLLIVLTRDEINYTYLFGGIALGMIVILGIAILQFLFFKFKLDQSHFLLKKGVISKSDMSIAFERIQNISFKQNVIQQIIDVTQVEIETAGAKQVEISIKALPQKKAEALKQAIMAQVDISIDEASEAEVVSSKTNVLFKLSPLDLFKVSITENHLRSLAIIVSLYFSLIYQFEDIIARFKLDVLIESVVEENVDAVLNSVVLMVVLVIVLLFISIIVSLVRTFLVHFGLIVTLKNEALDINQGLLTKRNYTLKKEKVQYIRSTTNPLKKLMGIHNLVFKQASATGQKSKSKKQIKIVGVDEAHIKTMSEVLFGVQNFDSLTQHYPHGIYIVIMGIRSLLVIGGVNLIVYFSASTYHYWWLNSILILMTALLVWLKFKKAYFKINDACLIKGHGQIETYITYFECYRIQSVQLKQSFFQKRRGVANLVIQTSSGKIRLAYIPASKARELYNFMLYKAQSTDQKWM